MIRSGPPAAGAALDLDPEDAPQAPGLHALQGAADRRVRGALFGLLFGMPLSTRFLRCRDTRPMADLPLPLVLGRWRDVLHVEHGGAGGSGSASATRSPPACSCASDRGKRRQDTGQASLLDGATMRSSIKNRTTDSGSMKFAWSGSISVLKFSLS